MSANVCLSSTSLLVSHLSKDAMLRQEEPKSLCLVAPDVTDALTHGHADVDSGGADTLHAGHQAADNKELIINY